MLQLGAQWLSWRSWAARLIWLGLSGRWNWVAWEMSMGGGEAQRGVEDYEGWGAGMAEEEDWKGQTRELRVGKVGLVLIE